MDREAWRAVIHGATTKVVGCFLAGALGLEPRAYGFGDDAGKPASGGLLLKCIFQQSKSKSPPHSQNPIKKTKQIGNFRNKPTIFWGYGLICRNRRLRNYIIYHLLTQNLRVRPHTLAGNCVLSPDKWASSPVCSKIQLSSSTRTTVTEAFDTQETSFI